MIQEACASGARKHKACEILGISIRTFERWQCPNGLDDKRAIAGRIPGNKMSDDEQQQILAIANSVEFNHLPPTQIIPILADQGEYYASESTFYRLLRQAKMLQHRHASKPRQHSKPKQLVALSPNQVWSWDITYLSTTVSGVYFYLYLFLDIFSRKIVGWSVHESESAELAANLVKQIYLDEQVGEGEVVLHSDNGSPMKGATMLMTLKKLGILTSFSRPSVSDDNPYSESLFKTMKYSFNFPSKPFNHVEDAIDWVEQFVKWYNYEHRHSAIKFVTPEQRHTGVDKIILAARRALYKTAQKRNPERWSGSIRDWRYIDAVTLNPCKPEPSMIPCS